VTRPPRKGGSSRFPQRSDSRGSLRWIQHVVNNDPGRINRTIRDALGLPAGEGIVWKSPLAHDEYAEYRDGAFLELLGLGGLAPALSEFWPRNGPQWDALGVTAGRQVLLVEAKARLRELSSACGASPRSRARIAKAMEFAKGSFGATPNADWLSGFYQYANRLAHLAFLRAHGVQAHLCGVYFINARDVAGPVSAEAWAPVLRECHDCLGLPRDRSSRFVHTLYIDVGDIATVGREASRR